MSLYIPIIILAFLPVYVLYLYKKIHYHFDKNGIKYVKGLPIFGNAFKSTFLKKHTVEDIDDVYKAFPEERYVGYMQGTRPVIVVRDPELIKLITVKEFDSFMSRQKSFPVEIFPLLGRGLVSMDGGDGWRKMRNRLSPSFTGSKLRYMLPSITEICKDYVLYLKEQEAECIDVRDLVQRYTTDAFSSAVFGVQINSVKDRDNKFYKAGQDVVTFTVWKRIFFFLATQSFVLAKILHFFGVGMMSDENTQFFRNIVTENIEYRKKNEIKRPDLIHFLMEASDEWTPDDITGQALSFFFADFESLSSTITMCIHELALNPEIQEKLYQEIKKEAESNEKLTYESLNDMQYLDCVISETTRKWSAAVVLDRVCTKAYDLPPPSKGGKPYRVRLGQNIYNVANSIHLDPKYHPDPEVYNPDRFSEENKHKIVPFTFVPFGMGPRNCLGIRFAMLQMNAIIFYLVLNFKLLKCEKTSDPICLMPNKLSIKAIGGTWIRVQSRQ